MPGEDIYGKYHRYLTAVSSSEHLGFDQFRDRQDISNDLRGNSQTHLMYAPYGLIPSIDQYSVPRDSYHYQYQEELVRRQREGYYGFAAAEAIDRYRDVRENGRRTSINSGHSKNRLENKPLSSNSRSRKVLEKDAPYSSRTATNFQRTTSRNTGREVKKNTAVKYQLSTIKRVRNCQPEDNTHASSSEEEGWYNPKLHGELEHRPSKGRGIPTHKKDTEVIFRYASSSKSKAEEVYQYARKVSAEGRQDIISRDCDSQEHRKTTHIFSNFHNSRFEAIASSSGCRNKGKTKDSGYASKANIDVIRGTSRDSDNRKYREVAHVISGSEKSRFHTETSPGTSGHKGKTEKSNRYNIQAKVDIKRDASRDRDNRKYREDTHVVSGSQKNRLHTRILPGNSGKKSSRHDVQASVDVKRDISRDRDNQKYKEDAHVVSGSQKSRLHAKTPLGRTGNTGNADKDNRYTSQTKDAKRATSRDRAERKYREDVRIVSSSRKRSRSRARSKAVAAPRSTLQCHNRRSSIEYAQVGQSQTASRANKEEADISSRHHSGRCERSTPPDDSKTKSIAERVYSSRTSRDTHPDTSRSNERRRSRSPVQTWKTKDITKNKIVSPKNRLKSGDSLNRVKRVINASENVKSKGVSIGVARKRPNTASQTSPRKVRRTAEDHRVATDKSHAASSPSKKTTATDTVELTMAIVLKEYPDQLLTPDQGNKVQQAILAEVFRSPPGTGPQFVDSVSAKGIVTVTCENKYSRLWLQNNVLRLRPWPEAKLRAKTSKYVTQKVKVIAWIPVEVLDAESIGNALELISSQNERLNTIDWEMESTERKEAGTTMVMYVDQPSLCILKEMEYMVFLGLSRVTLRVLGVRK